METQTSHLLDLIERAEALVESWQREIKMKARRVNPGSVDPNDEAALQDEIDSILKKYTDLLSGYIKQGKPVPDSFYAQMSSELGGVLEDSLANVYLSSAIDTQAALDNVIPISIDWSRPNENAQAWARQYTFDLVRGLQDTTQEQVQANIASLQKDLSDFFEKPTTLSEIRGNIGKYIPDWQDRLGRVWSSDERAKMIATTEITRASVQGDLDSVRFLSTDYGIDMIPIWQTSRDEKVCPICGPLHNKRQGDEWSDPPPAHVNCRCAISFELAT